jgi:hypothetical protein
MHFGKVLSVALLLAFSACSGSERLTENASTEGGTPSNDMAARPAQSAQASPASVIAEAAATAAPRSCAAQIGAAAAAQRVKVCRNTSPATHPPCNAANSCAMIEDEIARSCALFDGDEPPMKGCGPDPKGMQAAADVVRRYYSAIDARDYATAWTQWGDDGRPGQSFKAFENGFAQTRSTQVKIGALEPGDGGAGSIYQPVPVTVEATLVDGTRQRFTGSYIVRRINDVDGASPSQLRWHIDSAQLRRAPVD